MVALTQDINHVLNQARVKLPGSSDAALKAELYDVFQEFFSDSSTWTENIQVNVLPNTQDYAMVPAEGGQIIRLAGVVDAQLLPHPANMPDFGVLHLGRIYASPVVLTATVIKNTTFPVDKQSIPDVPDWSLSVYGVTILDGLLARMMAQPQKTYTNESLSVYHAKKFNDGIAMARVAKLRRNTIGTQSWSYPQSFRTRNQRGGVSVGANTSFGL